MPRRKQQLSYSEKERGKLMKANMRLKEKDLESLLKLRFCFVVFPLQEYL
jgi:hypothetical protein